MKAYMLFAGTGPLMILTSHESIEDPPLLERLDGKGLRKFIAYEVPVAEARTKYGKHFDIVCADLHQTDDLRVLDFDGHRVMSLFDLSALGQPIMHQPELQNSEA